MVISVDPEIEALIPPLSDDEKARLEESLVREGGATDALTVWEEAGVLLDGHNRYKICEARGLSYRVERKSFESKEAAMAWVISHQLGRRNLGSYDRGRLVLKQKELFTRIARANMAAGGKGVQIGTPLNTGAELARAADVSRTTLYKVEAIESAAPLPIREAARAGDISISRAYDVTKALAKSAPEVADVVIRFGIDDPEKVSILDRLYRGQRRPDSDRTFDEIAATGFIQPGEEGEAVHISAPILDIHKALKEKARLHALAARYDRLGNAPALPDGVYDLIYADPPWQYEHPISNDSRIENKYPTMPLEDIVSLPVWEIAARDCTLLLWATAPKFAEAVHVLEAWGFSYRTNMVWDKQIVGQGHYVRVRHEHLIIAIKGAPGTPPPSDRPVSILSQRRTSEHSEKPKLYDLIDSMYPFARRKIELFARDAPKGWHTWGNDRGLSQQEGGNERVA